MKIKSFKNLAIKKILMISFALFLVASYFLSFYKFFNTNTCKVYFTNYKKNVFLSSESEIEEELSNNINNQLEDINFEKIEELLSGLDTSSQKLLNNNTFLSLVKKFINGENTDLYSNFFTYALNVIFENIINFVPFLSLIIVIAVLYTLMGQLSSEKTKSVSEIIHIVCFSSIAVIVLKLITSIMTDVSTTIGFIEKQMEVIFPIILTLISAIGSVVTVSSFQPILAILSVAITKLFTTVLIPIFVFSVVFGIVGNISKNVKMEKFSKFFTSLFNWIIGIVFTVFIAFLTIQGLTVASIDSISLKTAKYAIKSYVPILGSYLSDGVGLILASSVLIKNAIGGTGLVLLIATIFLPIIKIVILMLLLKLVSAVLETLSDQKISNFLFSISKSLNMLNVCLLAVGFMYLISISILMCCSNIL